MNMFVTFFCLLSVLSGIPAPGTAATGKELFPEIKGWELQAGERIYTPADLYDLINGAAEAYLSYDFINLHLADYKQNEILVHVELYHHSSLENVFGIYSSERSPDYNFIQIGTEGYLEESVLNFFSGNYYVKIYSTDAGEDVQQSLWLIGKEVEQALAQENRWPAELMLLPALNRVQRSELYVANNFLGFKFLHSAFTADYSDGEDFQVFIIHAGSRKEIIEMLEEYLAFTKQDIDPSSEDRFTITDPYNGDIQIMFEGNYLSGVVNCGDINLSDQYLEIVKRNLVR